MTEEQLAAFVPDLVRWEGATTWMYRDTLGYVTVGIGNLVHDSDEAIRLPFKVDGRDAMPEEIQRDFIRVIGCNRGMPAASYRLVGALRVELTNEGVRDLAVSRLKHEFMPGLSRLFIGFDDLPRPAQSALVDMAWNLGISGLAQFSHLRDAVARQDWNAAAASCHVKTSRPDRNEWRAEMFRSAAG